MAPLKHTPGPWEVSVWPHWISVGATGHGVVATVPGNPFAFVADAVTNAKLIAAAPDLAEALLAALAAIAALHRPTTIHDPVVLSRERDAVNHARAALRKAGVL